MSPDNSMQVEVVYALPEQQWLVRLDVPEGCSAADAIARSGLGQRIPGGLPQPAKIGIWNRVVTDDAPLKDGDRVEIYRPLQADPKEARRNRARQAR